MTYRNSRLGRFAALVLIVPLAPAVSRAQQADSAIVIQSGAADGASAPAVRASAHTIFGKRDLALAAGFTAAAVALFPMDKRITAWVRSPQRLENGTLKGTMAGAEWGVEKGSLIAAVGLWGTGLVTRNRTLADMGFHTLASIAVTQQVTQVMKGAFGRARPYLSSDSLPHDFQLGSGFSQSDRRSFPSGHTSMAFATATALSHEISRASPRVGKVATPLLYAGAASAALSRIYHDQHWASDVTLGAAVGILTTRATLRLLHGRPGNLLDRVALHTRIVPRGDGAIVVVSAPTP